MRLMLNNKQTILAVALALASVAAHATAIADATCAELNAGLHDQDTVTGFVDGIAVQWLEDRGKSPAGWSAGEVFAHVQSYCITRPQAFLTDAAIDFAKRQ